MAKAKKVMTYKGTKQVGEKHPIHFDGVAPEANVPEGHDVAEHGHRKLSGSLMHELQGSGEMSNSYGQNKMDHKSLEDETMEPSGVGPNPAAKKYRGY